MSKRLAYLEKVVGDGTADAFARYALALEYKSLGRTDDAVRAFADLRARDPGYVPQYLMCGTLLVQAGRAPEGREWLSAGVAVARSKGDAHALSELERELAAL